MNKLNFIFANNNNNNKNSNDNNWATVCKNDRWRKLQYYISKKNNTIVDFLSKKITENIFTTRFLKYSNYVDFYKKKLNIPINDLDEETNGNDLLQTMSNVVIPK